MKTWATISHSVSDGRKELDVFSTLGDFDKVDSGFKKEDSYFSGLIIAIILDIYSKKDRNYLRIIGVSIVSLLICGPALSQTIDGGAVETVPGTHASPWNIGVLSVGNTSTGTLHINAGGIVSSSSSFIAAR